MNGITEFYISDYADEKIFVYSGAGVYRETFDLNTSNAASTGITYYDNKLWVLNNFGSTVNKVFVYNEADGAELSTLDFDLDAANSDPQGITFGENKFWVTDSGDNKVYAYNTDGTRDATLDFDLNVLNDLSQGITYRAGKLNVIDSSSNHLFRYSTDGISATSNEAAATTWEESEDMNNPPTGLTATTNSNSQITLSLDRTNWGI